MDIDALICRTDLQGRLVFITEAFCQAHGLTSAALQHRPLDDLLHPLVPRRLVEHLQQTLASGRPWLGPLCHRRGDGGELWLELYIKPVHGASGISGYGAVFVALDAARIEPTRRGYQRIARHGHPGGALWWRVLRTGVCGLFWRRRIAGLLKDHPKVCSDPWLAGFLPGDTRLAQVAWGLRSEERRLQAALVRIASAGAGLGGQARDMAGMIRDEARQLDYQRDANQQVATALHELAATIQEVTRNVQVASQSTGEASTLAGEGQQQARKAGEALVTLEQAIGSSARAAREVAQEVEAIGGFTSLIDAIASQTNLLALNAAIEAARAGEAGRGFSVVADEVRQLAARTQEATARIRPLLERLEQANGRNREVARHCEELARAGAGRVQEVASALSAVAGQLQGVDSLGQQIAVAMHEQEQVVQLLDEQLQGNVEAIGRSVEQARVAEGLGGELKLQSENLLSLARYFDR
ncbi:methyl-accepting chemotaxis protein [Pseudomonas putida]|uniref:Methyl-accepting chemotaxis protein PctB n=1 Tax=Pseudomonas putida TaxID=303 RepID=A0A1Q9QYM5_PSEPU|nr:methyl-accepting chemotaxis protein [Pseudomonas putida]OLS60238.1 Methyl-accepting chemotaxis protein PctB [Pseudomonas putida]